MENKTVCLRCDSTKTNLTVKLVSSGKPHPYPKFIPMIKQSCVSCGVYIKFAQQTSELIEAINQQLEKILINYE